jgi:hypothetical protein
MSYRKAIESISGWQEMTDGGVIAATKAKSFLYVDTDRWTLLGIAQIIGPTSGRLRSTHRRSCFQCSTAGDSRP